MAATKQNSLSDDIFELFYMIKWRSDKDSFRIHHDWITSSFT